MRQPEELTGVFMNTSKENAFFESNDFPIKIRAHSISTVDDIEMASSAMHEAVEIKYFYEGESTLLVGNKTVRAIAGDVIVINPYEIHATLDYGKDEKGKYCLIMVGLDFFDGITSASLDLRHLFFGKQIKFQTQFRDNERMREILTRIVAEHENADSFSNLAIFGLMAEFFAILQREGIDGTQKNSSKEAVRYYSIIEPAIRMIRDGYSQSITVDRLADACRISKYHFCRVFKIVTGMSAIQYLNSYRLKIADIILANTEHHISDIASMCGFDDTSYFCRSYKKHFGKTPRHSVKK